MGNLVKTASIILFSGLKIEIVIQCPYHVELAKFFSF